MKFAERFSTLKVPAGRRVASWTEAASDRFVELDFEIHHDEFTGSMLHRDLATLSVTNIVSAAHSLKRITRCRHQIARAAEEFFLVSLQLEGVCSIRQDGREAVLKAGEFALYDTTRPYELRLEQDYQQIVLRVPRRTLVIRLGDGCEALTATAVPARGGAAGMLMQMAHTVASEAREWHPEVASDVADGMISVLSASLRALRGESADTVLAGARHRSRIKAYVLAHLSDPGLRLQTIAAALGLSGGYLHRLFQSEGTTLERWIWARRLECCERLLGDPAAAGRSITEIAFAAGFSDTAHFSRRFRHRNGLAPRDYRKRCLRKNDEAHAQ